MTHANRPTESPSRLSAKINARHLEEDLLVDPLSRPIRSITVISSRFMAL
jgi:hypothetical protein